MVSQPLDAVIPRVTGFLSCFRKGRVKYANKSKAQKAAQLIFRRCWMGGFWIELGCRGRKKNPALPKSISLPTGPKLSVVAFHISIFIILLGTSNSFCSVRGINTSTAEHSFVTFPGQGWQFFTWNCNVGDTWNVQLATALCNLAVSREEEIPPPNPSGFSCSAMKMPPVLVLQVQILMWQILSSPATPFWAWEKAGIFPRWLQLNEICFKNHTGGDQLHLKHFRVNLFG